jgi:hypothetical protein
MSPRPLFIDFQLQQAPRSPWGYALVVAGLIAAAVAANQYLSAREALSSAELQLESLKRRHQAGRAAPRQPLETAAQQQLLRTAERVARDLNTPWDALLLDLESMSDAPVALLSFEPDAQQRQLRLIGEAKTLADAFDYVARLEGSPVLSEPHLVSHEIKESEGVRVIGFTVLAKWEDPA